MPGLNEQHFRGPPYEGSSNGYPPGGRQQAPPSSYYYSRGGEQQRQSPASTNGKMAYHSRSSGSLNYNGNGNGATATLPGESRRRPAAAPLEETPSYWVEHLATFAVGKQFGLEWPSDGIRKLKQMEKNSAIWAQPMVLRLRPTVVSVEDENGELVEQFPMELVADPTAHLSTDPRDVYNNILLFVVREDRRSGQRSTTPTEMHIFQCNRVSANEVVDDIRAFLGGQYQRVRTGRRDTGFVVAAPPSFGNGNGSGTGNGNGYARDAAPVRQGDRAAFRDDASASSDASEYFERDVNTLNRCFDDIERFVARIQSAALAQRELESQHHRYRTAQRGRRDQQMGILQLRAQLPGELEFVDILQKFKLSFNLLAKLKNHIHEPNAPELLHFLFTPLTVILDACQWGLGRNIAPQIVSPLLARETKELMQNCLTSKESDVWMALGDAWRVPPEDWPGPLPPPYRPVFADGFMPYGPPVGMEVPGRYPQQPTYYQHQAPPPQPAHPTTHRGRSVDNLAVDVDRMTLERERLEFEREKVIERERRLMDEERRIRQEKNRLEAERRMLVEEQERRSVASERPAPGSYYRDSAQNSPTPMRRTVSSQPVMTSNGMTASQTDQSPRQKSFFEDLRQRRSKVVQATYDRVAQNPKELTVTRGEFLEVLSDSKNWWECRNVHNRIGYVPHTILSVVATREDSPQSVAPQDPLFIAPTTSHNSGPPSASFSQDRGVGGNLNGNVQNQSSISPRPAPIDTFEVMTTGVQANISYKEPAGNTSYAQSPLMNGSAMNGPTLQPQPMQQMQYQQPPQMPMPIMQQQYQPQPLQQQPTNLYQSQYTMQPQQMQQPMQMQTAPVPPPPAPGPPPDLRGQLTSVRLRPTQSRDDDPATLPRENGPVANGHDRFNGQQTESDHLEIITRTKQPEAMLADELVRTIGRGQARQELLNNRASSNNRLVLSEVSSSEEVFEWLKDRGFSNRTMSVLNGQTGATLFALTKRQLQDFCGKDEGQRIYSQLLVQKSTSGYHTRSGAELKAILNERKKKSEEMAAAATRAIQAELNQSEFTPHHSGAAEPATSSPVHSVRSYDRK